MGAIKDFLLEYYVWVLAVLVVLLITIIGFLADTKKKKKLREKGSMNDNNANIAQNNNVNPNIQNVGMNQNINPNMDMNQNIGMDANMNLNNQNITNDFIQQNSFNNPFNANLNNVNNGFEQVTENVNNNPFFTSNQNQESQVMINNVAPTPIETVPLTSQTVNSVPAAIVEPTEVTNLNNQNVPPTPMVESMQQQVQTPYPSVQVEPNQMSAVPQNFATQIGAQESAISNQGVAVPNNVQVPVMPNQGMVNNVQMPSMPNQGNPNQMNNGNWQL